MRTHAVDICIIEDDDSERALLFRRLTGHSFSVVEARDAEAGLAQVRQHRPRVVICDLMLPGMDGLNLCRRMRSDASLDGTYLIMITACEDRDAKNNVLNAGADDYLIKPYDVEELLARLRNGMRINKLQDRLRRAAFTDGLTGLWNHGQFRAILDREFARTRRYGGVASLLMLDLDHFKAVNDTYGHETGNHVLEAMARHLCLLVRDTDTVARYGGEEFAVICPATNLDDATQLAERIRLTVPDHVRLAGQTRLQVTASIGVASTSHPRATDVTELINLADQALYVGKRSGRNRVVRCDQVDQDLPVVEIEHAELERLQKQVYSLSVRAKDLCLQSIWALVQALEARDRFTAWHSRNTTFYTRQLAAAAELDDSLKEAIANAAMLHDLGKIGVPDTILQYPDALSEEQSAVLRQVPLMTCKILEPLRVFETEILIIRHLRERFDGSGYPFGLVGTSIPIGSRLLCVAEAFDALTSERAHRSSRTIDEALGVIESESGRHFDPQFTALLLRIVREQRHDWQAHVERARAELQRCESGQTQTS